MSRKPRKRANGEGTVYQLANGMWRATYTAGWKPDGKPIRKSVSGGTRKEAIEKMQDMIAGYRKGRAITSGQDTVEQYLTRWLEDRVKGSVRESTLARYRSYIASVIPYVGSRKLRELKSGHLQAMIAAMSERFAPATLSRLRAVLHHAFEGAVEWELIDRNPVKYVDTPKVEKQERASLTPAEARRLFDVTRRDRMQPLWVILATCGLRISEALNLTWDDIDGDYLHVRKGKTKAAERPVGLVPEAKEALERRSLEQKLEQMRNRDIWQESRLVFTTKTGKPIYPSAAWRSFQAALRDAGLPAMRLHDLRRTAVAWLREAGVDADVVQVWVGHEHIATTLDIYGSVNRTRLEDARRKLTAYLSTSAL